MANHFKGDGREDPASESLLNFEITYDFRAFVRQQLIPAEGAAVTPEMDSSSAKMIGRRGMARYSSPGTKKKLQHGWHSIGLSLIPA